MTIVLGALGYYTLGPLALSYVDRYFPEGEGAQMIDIWRMQPCGYYPAVGKAKPKRRWCGVSDDFVGPLQDPRKVK